jgi:hypothetical protein
MDSGDGIASGVVLTKLIEALIRKGILNRFEAFSLITSAQTEIAGLTSPAGLEAKTILTRLLTRFPAQ